MKLLHVLCILLLFFAIFKSTKLYAQVSFETHDTYNIGESPYSLRVGDFNNDGFLDMVSGNFTNTVNERITIAMNNASGVFIINNLSASENVIAVDTADFNDDGNLDFAAAVQSGDAIGVYLGNGDGTFVNVEYAAGDGPNDIITGDFNKDGNQDIAVLHRFSDDFYIYYGDGSGTFPAPQIISIGSTMDKLTSGDFNNDTNLDLIAGGGSTIEFYAGDGAGNFSAAVVNAGFFGAVFLDASDINNDGNLDIRCNAGTLFYQALGAGDGTFSPAFFPVGGLVSTEADFDKDGNLDIISQRNSKIIYYPGDGSGNYGEYRKIDIDFGGRGLVAGDWDNDGNTDIALAGSGSGFDRLLVIFGKGDGYFRAPFEYPLPNNPRSMAMADFNGDGQNDLAVSAAGSGVNNLYMFLGQSNGTFINSSIIDGGTFPSYIEAISMNGDPFMDLVVLDDGANTINLFAGDGTGTLTPAGNFPITADLSMSVEDVNRDNIMDIILSGSGNVEIFRGNGDGTFNLLTNLAIGETVSAAVSADINNDTDPDLAIVVRPIAALAQIRFFQGDGIGGFTPAGVDIDLTAGGGTLNKFDFDNNGQIDFASVGNGGTGELLVGDGTFSFISSTKNGGIGGIEDVDVMDFDGDGIKDLIYGGDCTFCSPSGGVDIYKGNGDGTFGAILFRRFRVGGFRMKIADFNNDGQNDIAGFLNNTTHDALIILLNNTAPLPCVSPSILGISASFSACENTTAFISVNAAGDIPLSYQWLKDGSNITGATASLLTLSTIIPTDAADYRCIITNSCGAITSSAITLTVLASPVPPAITGALDCAPAPVTLTAAGSTNGNYRWYDVPTGGNALAGEVNSTFTTPVLSVSTDYYVSINDGICESNRVMVTASILQPVAITNQPQDQNVMENDILTMTVTATGDNLMYQWQKDGNDIPGEISDILTIPSASILDEGNYTCQVSNSCSFENSSIAVVTVIVLNFSVIDTDQNQTIVNGQAAAIDFGQTSRQNNVLRDFIINNTSTSLLLINDITSSDPIFRVFNIPVDIQPQSSETFTVELDASIVGQFSSDIVISTVIGNFIFPVTAEVIDPTGDLIIYNAVAPDGDGKNDYFKLENIENFSKNRVEIYNRWGEKVFEVTGYNNQNPEMRFEGRSNVSGRSNLTEGNYFYVIRIDDQKLSGFLFLRR